MNQWQQKKLGDLVCTKKGYAFKSKWYQDTGIPIVKVSDFTADSIDTSSLVRIPDSIAEQYSDYKLHTGDIVIQTVGSWPSNPASVVGKCIHVPSNAEGALLNQNAVILFPKNELNKDYLYYLLKSQSFKGYIINSARGSASQASITLEAIRNFETRLPPQKIQVGIASVLSTYDDLIENNTRRIELLEQSAQELYKEWFVRLKFPGHERAKMIDGVPESWQRVTLGEVCYLRNERVNPLDVEQNTPYVGLEHIPRESITLRSWGASETVTSTKLRFEKRDVLFGKIRPYFHKVVFAPTDGICSSDTLIINTEKPDLYLYLLATVSSVQFVKYTSTTVKEGSKMPRADWDMMMRYPLYLPPKPLLSGFNTFMQTVVEQLENLIFQNQKLQQARDLLLPKLMTGEIVV